jgi:hypothetical protein
MANMLHGQVSRRLLWALTDEYEATAELLLAVKNCFCTILSTTNYHVKAHQGLNRDLCDKKLTSNRPS